MLRNIQKLLYLTLLLGLVPALILGQASFEAQVRGVVHDSSGGVIVGAKVTITDARQWCLEYGYHGRPWRSTPSMDCDPATYTLVAEMSGFRPEETQERRSRREPAHQHRLRAAGGRGCSPQ